MRQSLGLFNFLLFYGYKRLSLKMAIFYYLNRIVCIDCHWCWIFISKGAYEKLSNETKDRSDSILNLENLHELNFQRVPSLLPKMYNVDSNGHPLFTIEPAKGRLARWLTVFALFEKGFIIPVNYDILDRSGQRIASFTIRDNIKRYELSLRGPDGALMNTYVQHLIEICPEKPGHFVSCGWFSLAST